MANSPELIMSESLISSNRFAEDESAENAQYRRNLAKQGMMLLSDARKMPDEILLARLRDIGVELDRQSLGRLIEEFPSAEEISQQLVPRKQPKPDWAWLAPTVLWERWFPDRPSFEMLHERVREGRRLRMAGENEAAARAWLEAWRWVVRILDAYVIPSLEEFDARYRSLDPVIEMIQHLSDLLDDLGADDPAWLRERLRFCEECLERVEEGDGMLKIMRNAMATTHFELGDRAQADALFEAWLAENPRWGWGWMTWADCYEHMSAKADQGRARQILERGFAVPGVKPRRALAARLAGEPGDDLDFDEESEWEDDLDDEETIDMLPEGGVRLKKTVTFGGQGLPLDKLPELTRFLRSAGPAPTAKTGRNDPCPCGSGKKFKKCCGGHDYTV
jgi:tetratricopeptide (TPR) repeat protein